MHKPCKQTTKQQLKKITPENAASHYRNRRDNHEWLNELTGSVGHTTQWKAHEDLANYLFVIIQDYLLYRHSEFLWLATMAQNELACIAEDLVQICLEKISRNEHALLTQFQGKGAFTSWVAQMALNETRTELRRVRWNRLQSLDKSLVVAASASPNPEQVIQREYLSGVLNCCLDQLSERYRTVLIRFIVNKERARTIATDFKVTEQAVYNLLNRAKKQLGDLLVKENITSEDLTLMMD